MIKPGASLATGSLELRALKSGESASFTKLVKLLRAQKKSISTSRFHIHNTQQQVMGRSPCAGDTIALAD